MVRGREDTALIRGLLYDLRHYKWVYIKSLRVANALKEMDEHVTTEYDAENRHYIARYAKR